MPHGFRETHAFLFSVSSEIETSAENAIMVSDGTP